jgi:hypothetical protein
LNGTLSTGDVINIGGSQIGSVATTNFRGIELHSAGNRDYYIGKLAGAWTQPLDVHFYTGVRITANPGYDYGTSIWHTDGTIQFSVGEGDNNTRIKYIGYAGSSFRAPIFYDSNDTSYYVDPNSVSVLSSLRLTSDNALFIFASNGAYQRVDSRNESSASRAHWYGVLSDGNTSNFRHAWYDGSAYFNVTASGGELSFNRVGGSGYVSSNESLRAPVFYDLNNTSYYADLNSTGDSIRAAGNITAYYSDMRLKRYLGKIENALDKVKQLEGFYYEANEIAQKLGYKPKREVGVSAQSVQEVLPEIVADAPINSNYLTISYERLTPLLIEAIKEQNKEVVDLRAKVERLESLISKLIDV